MSTQYMQTPKEVRAIFKNQQSSIIEKLFELYETLQPCVIDAGQIRGGVWVCIDPPRLTGGPLSRVHENNIIWIF